ncbi:methyl-accepting chemotaxis protein [Alteromonas flava]|uniref:methyl-accepting chemotaxis protein n=1 Tax=Alteromonas flava TaxID=2048003 RepID=UPI000C283645|nr:methyl-accepting chemotaxis protein [Alteromonas flava]
MTMYSWTAQANSIFRIVLIVQFALALFIAAFTDTWFEAIIIGGLIVAFPLALLQINPAAPMTRYIVGIAVQLITALHIQQTSGLVEMHFEIFVLLAILSVYRDWKVIAISTVVVAVHHILFFVLQSNQVGVYIFQEGYVTLWILAIHAGFALTEGGILIFTTRKSYSEAMAGFVLTSTISKIFADPKRINLSVDIQGEGQEIEEFKRLISGFKSIINAAKQTASSVLKIVEDVDSSADKVSALLTQSSQEVDSIVHAIEQMSSTIENVAKQAENVSVAATTSQQEIQATKTTIDSVRSDIQALHAALGDTSNTIGRLSEMCNDIDNAMAAIKSISEQTNLLALNAAIESARAGEHGRGFAVVADEVRQLSIRTSENAEEISKITAQLMSESAASVEKVSNCVTQVENSVELSKGAGEKTVSVTQRIEELAGNIEQVASASEEQALMSNSIATSSNGLRESSNVQQSEATTTAKSIDALKVQISSLNEQLETFDV